MKRLSINIGQKVFAPAWFTTLLVLLVLPVFGRLGIWQWDRAQEKVQLQAAFEMQQDAPEVALSEVADNVSDYPYRRVRAEGYFLDQQFLLDNQPRQHISGYAVLTPFVTDGRVVLVNRGWVERPLQREHLPEVAVDGQQRQIRGKINFPGKAFGLGGMSLEQGWPLRIQYIDYPQMSERLSGVDIGAGISSNVEPFVIMLAEDEPDGYLRDWQPIPDGPLKNYSYMGQWFAMALAVLVLYIVLNLKTRESHDRESRK